MKLLFPDEATNPDLVHLLKEFDPYWETYCGLYGAWNDPSWQVKTARALERVTCPYCRSAHKDAAEAAVKGK